MITNETIRKVVINKALFPPVAITQYARRATAGTIGNFETNCEKPLSRLDIAYMYNVEDPQGITKANVVRTGANLFDPLTTFSAVGSYLYAKSIFPKGTTLICSFTDKDPTVDISGKYFGFIDDTYTSGGAPGGHYRWLIDNGNVQSNLTNITTLSIKCDGLFAYPQNQATIDTLLARFDIQIEVGSTATEYEAYKSNTYEIDFGTTVYGFDLDPISGTGKVRDIDGVESFFTFTPFNITTYNGVNNIFLDLPNSSLAVIYLVQKATEYKYTPQFLPIFYPDTIERSINHDYC